MNDYVYGLHSIKSLLIKNPESILEVFVVKNIADKKLNSLLIDLNKLGIKIQFANKITLDKKTNNAIHQGICIKIKPQKELNENDLFDLLDKTEKKFLLILDGITDPHNLGACLRTADAAGVTAIIVPKNSSAPLSAVAKKVACGAAETVPVIKVTNLSRVLNDLKKQNIWIIGTAGETEKSIYTANLTGDIALVLGSEETGMRRLTKDSCDEIIKIPMYGSVSSLNVSVATGICLYERVRQTQNN